MYKKGVAHIMGLTTPVDLDTDPIRIALGRSAAGAGPPVSNGYTHAHDTNEFLSELVTAPSTGAAFGHSAGVVFPTDYPLIGGTLTVQGSSPAVPGVFSSSATTTVFNTVTTGLAINLLIVFKEGASAAASPLLAIFDLSASPVTPNGSNITVTWPVPTDPNGIFRLVAGTGA